MKTLRFAMSLAFIAGLTVIHAKAQTAEETLAGDANVLPHKNLSHRTFEEDARLWFVILIFLYIDIPLLVLGGRVAGLEPPTPWSRTWGRGADFVSIQSFEWCFNRVSLAESRQFGRNVNPPVATLARVSADLSSQHAPA
jgi:hypothetical protein